MSDSREQIVRQVAEAALKVSLDGVPADKPLEEAAFYDSLAKLELIVGIEKAFGLVNGDIGLDHVDSIDLILARLTELARTAAR